MRVGPGQRVQLAPEGPGFEQQEQHIDDDQAHILDQAADRAGRAGDIFLRPQVGDELAQGVLALVADQLQRIADNVVDPVLVFRDRGDDPVDAGVDQHHDQRDRQDGRRDGEDRGDRVRHRDMGVFCALLEGFLERDHQVPDRHGDDEGHQEIPAHHKHEEQQGHQAERGSNIEEAQPRRRFGEEMPARGRAFPGRSVRNGGAGFARWRCAVRPGVVGHSAAL